MQLTLDEMKRYPRIARWNDAPQMDVGAPRPSIVVRDQDLYMAYALSDRPETYAIVRFSSVLQHVFGYPNDEALGEHPLYSAGLEPYKFNEVVESPCVEELAKRNERAFPGSGARILERKHWIVPFHDETLEVIGDAVEYYSVVSAKSGAAAIEKNFAQQSLLRDGRNASA